MGLLARSKVVAEQISIDLPPGEAVEHSGPANHFHNFESLGGRLYLTNRNLIFKPHKFDLQDASISNPRCEIATVSKCRTLGLMPNGLLVSQRSGDVLRFVVTDRSAWLRAISELGR
ncbi:MAG: GRAM domain-containing protein [Roseiarcus sp.]